MASGDKIQLYSLITPNGQKIAVALEEMGIPYDAHTVNILKGEQFTPEFLAINPNGKIPAIVDPQGPGGKPLPVFESGAILLYLAEKSGKFLPEDPVLKWETIQWLFFQVGIIYATASVPPSAPVPPSARDPPSVPAFLSLPDAPSSPSASPCTLSSSTEATAASTVAPGTAFLYASSTPTRSSTATSLLDVYISCCC